MPVRAGLLCVLLTTLFNLPAAAIDIVVDISKRHQQIEGFGTCLISWLPQIERLYSTEAFQRRYVETIGCSILRIELWPDVSLQPVADPEQIRWQDFNFEGKGRRGQVFIDFAAAAHRLNPEMMLIGTTWSPPAWMKVNGETEGTRSESISRRINDKQDSHPNRLKPDHYRHFAHWLAEWVKLFEAKGMRLAAVSPQNELMFSQSFNSCVYTPEEYARLVNIVAEVFAEEGLDAVRLFGPEHMTHDTWWNTQYINALEAAGALKHLDVFASHGYVDGFEVDKSKDSAAQLWKLIEPHGKPFWMTEGGTGGHDWPAPLREIAPMIHNSLVGGNVSAWVPWQITDPNSNEHGLMVGEQMTRKTHVAQHYFKYVRPGAYRIEATPSHGDVAVSAFLHPRKRTLTIVLINPQPGAQAIALRLAGDAADQPARYEVYRTSETEGFAKVQEVQADEDGMVEVDLPGESIVTLHGAAR